MKLLPLLAYVALFFVHSLSAQVIPNPSFETDSYTQWPGYNGGSNPADISGWVSSPPINAASPGINPVTAHATPNPFADNGAIPDGSQVAFIQSFQNSLATLSTTITGLTSGAKYDVSFRANMRAVTFAPNASWSLNGQAHVPFTASPAVGGANPYYLIEGSFVATGATAALHLQNQTPNSTLLVDDFQINEQPYFIPHATLSLSGSVTVLETDQRLAFNANPNSGTPATAGRTNVALAANGGSPFESSRISTTYGDDKLNNGVYGVSAPDIDDATRPWISQAADPNGWGGVKFASPSTLVRFGFGSRFDNRSDGTFTMQYTTDSFAGVDLETPAQVDALSWTTFGTLTSTTPTEFGRHLFELNTPVANVTGVRVVASQGGSTITEIEAYVEATLTVTTLADSGGGSLRDTITSASPGDTIIFDPSLSGQTITLGGTQLLVNKDLTIDASALANGITIDAAGSSRVFEINPGSTVSMNSLTLTGGNATGNSPVNFGGAIYSDHATLSLTACTLSGNSADFGGGIFSNGFEGSATLSLTACTLSGNSAQFEGGGIFSNGGDGGSATLSLTACTLSGNFANTSGGGIFSNGFEGSATLSLSACTLSGNSADFGGGIFSEGRDSGSATLSLTACTVSGNSGTNTGGGIYNIGSSGSATLSLENTILAGNTATTGPDLGEFGTGATTTLLGVNLISDTSGNNGLAPAAALIVDTDPELSPLGDYGGPTQTMPPLSVSSPAVDAAITLAGSPTTDQRGLPRIYGSFPDIGAAESRDFVTALADSGEGSLRDTIANAPAGTTITFHPSLSGQTITLSGTELLIDKDLAIDASALPDGITIDANNTSRVINITSGSVVTLDTLTITGGNATGSFGGGIYVLNSSLTLQNSTITGNSTDVGGGLYSHTNLSGQTTTLISCTITNNTATFAGGGIYNNTGKTSLTHCTITGNTAPAGKGSGGGSVGDTLTETEVFATIISGNTNSDIDFVVAATNSFTSNDANLIGTGNATGDFNQPKDQVGITNPQLATLGDYGGPTQTMPPLSVSSPAVDAAITIAGSPSTDQRDLPRIFGSLPDIGAAELQYFIVTTIADSGAGSLRDTITSASPSAIINFDPSLSGLTITLGGTQLLVNKDLTIDASALANGITIDAAGSSRVFEISSGSTVSMDSLTLTGGNATGASPANSGGAIYSDHATLSLTACTLSGNSASGIGGGINSDGGDGGSATLSLTACTLSGNSATHGGGINSAGPRSGSATLSLTACTLSGNSANFGGGIYNAGHTSGSATLSLSNSILAGNTATTGPDLRESGTAAEASTTLLGVNLFSDTSGSNGLAPAAALIIAPSPMLLPLGDYGGPTQTMPPLSGSPAIDAGGTTDPGGTDQRGLPRFLNGALDIGAVETAAPDFAALWPTDTDLDGNPYGIEHALGTDPNISDPGHPANLTSPVFNGSGHATFTFGRNPAAEANTIWLLKRSTTLLPGSFVEIFRFDGPTLTPTNQSGITSIPGATSFSVIDTTPPSGRAFYLFEAVYVP
ncbi:MAG: beta strand repeat-containing protein [Luteolibacter sp.]